jgi:hypothetical protein
MSGEAEQKPERWLKTVEDLAAVAPLLEIEADTHIDMDHLMQYQNQLHLIGCTQWSSECPSSVSVLKKDMIDCPNVGDSCAYRFLTGLDVGNRALVCVVAIVGCASETKDNPDRIEILSNIVRLLVKRNYRMPVTIDRKSLFDEAECILSNEGVQHVYRPAGAAER